MKPDVAVTVQPVAPRVLDKAGAAHYCGVSETTIKRLIDAGEISVVKVPVSRSAYRDTARTVLVDRLELDELITSWREKKGA